jgi:thiol-disulfide isomerase/thioredoxin
MGAALGPVFSSCSPTYFVILATVLPASFGMGLLDLGAYAVGLSGFLLIIALVGQRLVDRLGVAIDPEGWFRRAIGLLFLLVGVAVMTGAMLRFEAYLLNNGFDLTGIEQRLLKANEAPPRPLCANGYCPGATTSSEAATSTSDVNGKISTSPTKNNVVEDATLAVTLSHKAAMYQKSAELVSPDGYINTGGKPITIGEFKGKKVVLIDIWTYSCINCQRTLPYIKAWYDKYHDQGLEIISVHTPEFAFEKVEKNVQDAVMGFGIKYPVVLDNEYKTWNAFGNQYWPRKYLIDIDGFIVYDHAGEGSYDEAEKAIQTALAERSERLNAPMPTATITAPSDIVTVDNSKLGSPETYFGASRNQYLGNGEKGKTGAQMLTIPATLDANTLYLGGNWNFVDEYAQNSAANAKITFKYQAKNLYFVAAADTAVKIKVTRDGGQSLGSARGKDVDADGFVTISTNRLYQLIGDSDYGAHTIEITVQGPGLQAYTFTFG